MSEAASTVEPLIDARAAAAIQGMSVDWIYQEAAWLLMADELIAAAERIRRKADEFRALAEEHTEPGTVERGIYEGAELVLRDVAGALDPADESDRSGS